MSTVVNLARYLARVSQALEDGAPDIDQQIQQLRRLPERDMARLSQAFENGVPAIVQQVRRLRALLKLPTQTTTHPKGAVSLREAAIKAELNKEGADIQVACRIAWKMGRIMPLTILALVPEASGMLTGTAFSGG